MTDSLPLKVIKRNEHYDYWCKIQNEEAQNILFIIFKVTWLILNTKIVLAIFIFLANSVFV